MQYKVKANKNHEIEKVVTKLEDIFVLRDIPIQIKSHVAQKSIVKPDQSESVLNVSPLIFDLNTPLLTVCPSLTNAIVLVLATITNIITTVKMVIGKAIDGLTKVASISANPHNIKVMLKKPKFHRLSLLRRTLIHEFSFKVLRYLILILYSLLPHLLTFIIQFFRESYKQIGHLIKITSLLCFMSTSTLALEVALTEKQKTNYIASLMDVAEKKYGIPSGILMAIAKVESGMKIYGLNINGKPYIAKSQNEAINVIKQTIKSGISNVDIGVMQINYRWHGSEFQTLEEMLKPHKNIDYAASYLQSLKNQHGSWKKAIRYYHSAKIDLGTKYSKKVILTWLKRNRNSINEGRNV